MTRPARVVGSTYDPATNTVTIAPARKAKFPRGARVTVLPGVTDLAGNALDGGQSGIAGTGAVVLVRPRTN